MTNRWNLQTVFGKRGSGPISSLQSSIDVEPKP